MIAGIITIALPRPAHERHMGKMMSDMPQAIVDMVLSADAAETSEK